MHTFAAFPHSLFLSLVSILNCGKGKGEREKESHIKYGEKEPMQCKRRSDNTLMVTTYYIVLHFYSYTQKCDEGMYGVLSRAWNYMAYGYSTSDGSIYYYQRY